MTGVQQDAFDRSSEEKTRVIRELESISVAESLAAFAEKRSKSPEDL
jgi:hypothetical protein